MTNTAKRIINHMHTEADHLIQLKTLQSKIEFQLENTYMSRNERLDALKCYRKETRDKLTKLVKFIDNLVMIEYEGEIN